MIFCGFSLEKTLEKPRSLGALSPLGVLAVLFVLLSVRRSCSGAEIRLAMPTLNIGQY